MLLNRFVSSRTIQVPSILRSTRAILPLIFSAAFACCTLNAQAAQDTDSSPTHPMKCGMEGGGNAIHQNQGKRCGPIERLNLSDSQRASFHKAMEQMHQAMRGAREMHEELGDLVNSENYDASKVRDTFQKHSKNMEEQVVVATGLMHDFYLSLNAEQKAKFNEMRLRMRDRMQHFAEKRRHHHSDQNEDEETMHPSSPPDENKGVEN